MELTDYIVEMLATVVVILGGLAYNTVRTYIKDRWSVDFGRFLDEDAIVTALKAGKRQAKKKLGEAVSEAEFEKESLSFALYWLNNEFPQQLEKYDINPEQLRMWLEAKFDDV